MRECLLLFPLRAQVGECECWHCCTSHLCIQDSLHCILAVSVSLLVRPHDCVEDKAYLLLLYLGHW